MSKKGKDEQVLATPQREFIRYGRAVRMAGGARAIEVLEVNPELIRMALLEGHARIRCVSDGEFMDGVGDKLAKVGVLDEGKEKWTIDWALENGVRGMP